MTTFLAEAKAGKLSLKTEYNAIRFKEWMKKNDGAQLEIKPKDNPVSDQMRGYMFGAVIPRLQTLNPEWKHLTPEQIYEILKQEFNYFEAISPITGKPTRYGQSVMNRSCKNQNAIEFIARISEYVLENYQQTLPDSREYTAWRDSAPDVNSSFTEK